MGEALRYIFGPVLSGRLGRSLGLDLLGARVCSMNCVYCESGALEMLTLKRRPYVPADGILAELAAWEADRARRGEPLPEVVTLGGMGEPTLNSDMPEIIDGVRRILPGVPVAVLTNASLMTDPAVRAELAKADMVLPSLDSLVPEEYARVNRGHPGLNPNEVADGILAFRREAGGLGAKIYLEILLVQGVNDSARNLELLDAFCNALQPDRVDVTTLSRPGTEAWAKPVTKDTLALWRRRLGGAAAPGPRAGGGAGAKDSGPALAEQPEKGQVRAGGMSLDEVRARISAAILASVARRPQTAEQLAGALLADRRDVERALAELVAQGLAEEIRQGGQAEAADPAGAGASAHHGADVYYQARG